MQDTNGIASLNPFRYRGYYFDTELNLYYLNARYYDPEVGRFISQDSIKYLDPETLNGLNLFAYCLNNPVMETDPEGTSFLLSLIAVALIAGIISGAVNAAVEAAQGGSFRDCAGAFVGGFITGAAAALGGGLAVGAYTATLATTLGTVAFLTAGTFAGGAIAYATENWIKGNNLDGREAAKQGLLTFVQGGFSFLMGYASGGAGLWDSLKPGNGLINVIGKEGLINGVSSYFKTNAYPIVMRSFLQQIFRFPWNLIKP